MLSNVITINDRTTGVDEILTVYNSIICGFALPIRPEHIHFLKHCLIPLHKLDKLSEFSGTLTRGMVLMISREPKLCTLVVLCVRIEKKIIQGILHYWPKSNIQNEVILLDELERIISSVDLVYLSPIFYPLVRHIRRCIGSGKIMVCLLV